MAVLFILLTLFPSTRDNTEHIWTVVASSDDRCHC